MRKSFTRFLSLLFVFCLFSVTSKVYAQEAQETVELYAGTNSPTCYNESNSYAVNVSVKDFIQLTKFDLELSFPAGTLDYQNYSTLPAWTSTGTLTVTPNNSTGKVVLHWEGNPITIGNNVKTDIIQLNFGLDNFPNLISNSFTGNLTWSVKNFWYSIPASPFYDAVNTVVATPGSFSITQSYQTIETAFVTETCSGGEVKVRVTSPTGVLYSFDGGAFTSSNEFAALPENNVTIRVKNAAGCISHPKTVAVPKTLDPVSFTVTSTNPACPDGDASVFVTAVGGTGPYTYYYNTTPSLTGAVSRTNFQFNVPTGTASTTYYIAVQDANHCADLANGTIGEDLGFWQAVTVYDPNVPVSFLAGSTTSVTCYGSNNGSVTVALTPAAVYKVSMNGGSTWTSTASDGTKTFSGLVAGTYTITAKTVSECTISGNSVLTVGTPASMQLAIVITDTSCGGLNDGSIAVTVTGGTSTYTYKITESGTGTVTTQVSAANTVTFNNLKPTYYSLTVTDQNTCSVNYENPNGTHNVIAVQKPTDINITSVVATSPACFGGTGTITVTASAGSGSYIYAIENGGTTTNTTGVFKNLAVGTYTVTVQNLNGSGCAVTYPTKAAITAPSQLLADIGSTLKPTCSANSDGDVTLNISGGSAPYKYSVNNGPWITNVSSPAHIAVTVGTHIFTITDANNCQAVTLTATITQTASTISPTSSWEIACNGEKDGQISIRPWLTTWPAGTFFNPRNIIYKYAITADQVYTASGTTFIPEEFNNSTTFYAGDYWVGAVDNYGCQAVPVKVTIKEKAALQFVGNVTATGASCFNTFDGVIAISAMGGNSTNTNTWSGGFNGTWTAHKLQYAIVNSPDLSSIPNDRWIDFPNYNTTSKVFSVNVQAAKGEYYIGVRDLVCGKQIMYTDKVVVTGYEQIKIDESKIVVVQPLCNGLKTGSITVPASAVTGGSGSYKFTLLNNGATVSGTLQQTTGVFGGLATSTTYAVKVEDAAGCPSYTTSSTLSITEPPVLAFTVSKTNITCNGANNGVITINVTGGTHSDTSAASQYKYAVNNQNLWQSFTGNVKEYLATQPGTYTIWIKDANECTTVSQSVTITQPATVSATVTVTNANCSAGTGSIAITNVSGGSATSTYSYKVDNGTATTSTTISGISVGSHNLTVYAFKATDVDYQSATCTVVIPFTIMSPTPISYTVDVSNVKCRGGIDGALTVTVSGGTASSTAGYLVRVTGPGYDVTRWTGSDKTDTFAGMIPGMYTVYITDNKGCTLSPTVGDTTNPYTTIESWEVQQPATALSVSANRISNALCNGASNGVFTITATGGVAPYSFFTAKSALPAHIVLPDASTNSSTWIAVEGSTYTMTTASAGTWIVWAKDANNCIIGGEEDSFGVPVNEWRVQITEPSAITFTVGNTVSPTCNGKSDGSIAITGISGGTATYTVNISGTSKANTPVNVSKTTTTSSVTVTGLPASLNYYTITVSDVNGCLAATKTKTVNEPASLSVSLAASEGSFTCPGSVEGWINATVTGGVEPYKYNLYKDGASFATLVTQSTYFVQIGHTYTVEVIDNNGVGTCTATAQVTITEPKAVSATISETTCYSDANASVVIKATGETGRTFSVRYRLNTASYPATYTPMPNGALAISGLLFSNVNVGQNFYFFEIMDSKGCKFELTNKSFVATQHPLEVTVAPVASDDLKANLTITGGISPYTITYGTNSSVTLPVDNNTYQVVNLLVGVNTITVTDAHGCAPLVPVTFTVAPLTVTAAPPTGAANQANSFAVALTFNRDVPAGIASLTTVSASTGTPTVAVTGSGKTYTATITGADMSIVTLALSNGIKDAAGNTLSATNFSYTIGDHVAPTVVITGTPAATGAQKVSTLGMKFSEPVSPLVVGTNVTVVGGTASLTGSGDTYSLTVTAAEQTDVTITLVSALIKDLSANQNALTAVPAITYKTGDFTAPTAVYTPNGTTTPTTNNHPSLQITFNEDVAVATGNVKIYKASDNTLSVTIPVTAAMLSGKTVSLTYAGGLDKNTNYYVLVDGVVKDLAGNAFAGVTASSTWTFKTGANFATGIDPINNSLEFKVYPNPFVDFVTVTNASELSKVVVSNIAGQVVKEVVNPESTIQLNQLVSGVYFISLYQENVVIKTVKIVKR